ncbi:hypothetical protein ENBRE01_0486 [Enteropsectra breve]|nr:hypothetical protein ENBRE01_0486 [Enteropsectra breve]
MRMYVYRGILAVSAVSGVLLLIFYMIPLVKDKITKYKTKMPYNAENHQQDEDLKDDFQDASPSSSEEYYSAQEQFPDDMPSEEFAPLDFKEDRQKEEYAIHTCAACLKFLSSLNQFCDRIKQNTSFYTKMDRLCLLLGKIFTHENFMDDEIHADIRAYYLDVLSIIGADPERMSVKHCMELLIQRARKEDHRLNLFEVQFFIEYEHKNKRFTDKLVHKTDIIDYLSRVSNYLLTPLERVLGRFCVRIRCIEMSIYGTPPRGYKFNRIKTKSGEGIIIEAEGIKADKEEQKDLFRDKISGFNDSSDESPTYYLRSVIYRDLKSEGKYFRVEAFDGNDTGSAENKGQLSIDPNLEALYVLYALSE